MRDGQLPPRSATDPRWRNFLHEMAAIGEQVRFLPLFEIEMKRLALAVTDPPLYDLVQEALAPFPEDDDDPSEVVAAAVARRGVAARPASPPITKLAVSDEILGLIRGHAHSVKPGFESVGRLVVKDGAAIEYHRLRNNATAPRRCIVRASWPRVDGETSVITHSHPAGAGANPSKSDLAYARQQRWSQFGIYHLDSNKLAVFSSSGNGSTYCAIPVVLSPRPAPETLVEFVTAVPTRPHRRGVLVDLNRRQVLTSSGRVITGGYQRLEQSPVGRVLLGQR